MAAEIVALIQSHEPEAHAGYLDSESGQPNALAHLHDRGISSSPQMTAASAWGNIYVRSPGSSGYGHGVKDAEDPRMAFNRDAETYAQARPGYPDELFTMLHNRCGLRPGAQVVEIGPGTGQATVRLLEAGAHIVAVEPGPELARQLAHRFSGEPLTVVVSDFETAPLTGPFDLAIAATSLHWIDLPTGMRKLAGLIPAGGWLCAFWNVFQDPDRPTAFRAALDRLYHEVLPELKKPSATLPDRLRPESWSRDLEAGGWFGPVQTHFFRWNNPLTPHRARQLWATFSNIIGLETIRRERFLDGLAAIVRDEFAGHVDDPCVTAAYLAQRRPGPAPNGM